MKQLLNVIVGSHAYGLATESSDVDRRGVYVAPTESFWAFEKPPTSIEGPREEELSWELEHFCLLALKANPTVLEVLVTTHVEQTTPLGEELRALLPAFLSRKAVTGYLRATDHQMARAGRNLKPKQLMHVIRLRAMCLHLLRTGTLRLEADRVPLLAVRTGDMPWDDATAWAEQLRSEIMEADGPLPEEPDRAKVEDWLVSVRRRMLA